MSRENKDTAIFTAYDDHVPFDPLEPERNLLRAVLMSALNDVNAEGSRGEEAKLFFLDSDEHYIFSFQSICQFLSLDPGTILKVTGLEKERSGK
jgi:hypothetical protein